MKKSQKILIGVGAGVIVLASVAVIAGPTIYRDVIAAPAADAPSLAADEADGGSGNTDDAVAELDPQLLVGDWNVAEDSEAGYRVDEVLNGTDVTVTGRTDDVTGSFTIGDTGLTLEAADLTVDVATIATDNSNRDQYFRSEALRTDEFPEATFVLSEPVTLDGAPALGDVVQTEATGELTIAGETQTVTAEIEVRSDGETAEIAGSIPITFSDFGVEAPNLGFVSVEDSGAVEFQLTAVPAQR